MSDYIVRQAVMQEFANRVRRSNNSDFAPTPTWNQAVQIVEDFPAADVQPVRRGRWMYLYDENYRCSECGEDFALIDGTGFLGLLNYCPKCGAEMGETG